MKLTITEVQMQPVRDLYSRIQKRTRVYCWPSKETVLENVQNRHGRPVELYRRELLPALFERINLPSTTKATWSQKAGCSCGCSPGFILDVRAGREMPARHPRDVRGGVMFEFDCPRCGAPVVAPVASDEVKRGMCRGCLSCESHINQRCGVDCTKGGHESDRQEFLRKLAS